VWFRVRGTDQVYDPRQAAVFPVLANGMEWDADDADRKTRINADQKREFRQDNRMDKMIDFYPV
jgi:hypothetical protein